MNEKEIIENLEQFLLDCYNNGEINSIDELYEKAEAWQCENSTYNDVIDDYGIHQLAEDFADKHTLFYN